MKKYYVGMDVHLATISIAVMNEQGRVVSEAIIETKTEAVRNFIKSLRGELHNSFNRSANSVAFIRETPCLFH
jgi:activator of 2-hydroxyglutaryl-CoA dehydratase